ncbi:15749_t:CDS:2 [Gigaspora rosea]|nr:15749_t:CDS:2 [Gigaspora rosea]
MWELYEPQTLSHGTTQPLANLQQSLLRHATDAPGAISESTSEAVTCEVITRLLRSFLPIVLEVFFNMVGWARPDNFFVAERIHKIVQLEALRGHNYCERPYSTFR